MVKIIFELDENYIKKQTDMDVATKEMKDEPIVGMLKFLAFAAIESKFKEGKTEFVVRQENVDSELMKIYNTCVAYACVLASRSDDNANEEKNDEQKEKQNEDTTCESVLD